MMSNKEYKQEMQRAPEKIWSEYTGGTYRRSGYCYTVYWRDFGDELVIDYLKENTIIRHTFSTKETKKLFRTEKEILHNLIMGVYADEETYDTMKKKLMKDWLKWLNKHTDTRQENLKKKKMK